MRCQLAPPQDKFYWQCRPTDALDTCNGPRTLAAQSICGGLNMCNKDAICGTTCCSAGNFCLRQNKFTWQCQSLSAFKASTGGANSTAASKSG